jgi:hypothetical protein
MPSDGETRDGNFTRGFGYPRISDPLDLGWVQNLTRGSHPYPTRDKIGSGTGFSFHPRVLADIRNYFSFHF